MDYAIKKEKFLIEADPEMPEKTKINHMVIGLPINIQNELDKHEIKETNYLLSLVQKYDSENSVINKINIIEKSDYLNRSKADYNFAKQIKKKTCFKCEKLGKPNRYHPIDLCLNKKKNVELAKILVNESIIENENEIENVKPKN